MFRLMLAIGIHKNDDFTSGCASTGFYSGSIPFAVRVADDTYAFLKTDFSGVIIRSIVNHNNFGGSVCILQCRD